MIGKRFYHRCLAVMLLGIGLPLWAVESTLVTEEGSFKVPPRSIKDVTRMLSDYRQNDDLLRKLTVQADMAPPATDDKAVLFDFYRERGQAAGELGRVVQQIKDLELAVRYGKAGTAEFARNLRNLAYAEFLGGNYLAARNYAYEAARQVPDTSKGQLTGAYGQIVGLASQVGDFDMAAQALADLETTLLSLRKGKGWKTWSHFWLGSYEKARGDMFRMAGKQVQAEGAYRKALRENQAALADLPALLESGKDAPSAENLKSAAEAVERGLAISLQSQGKLVEAEAVARRSLENTLRRTGSGSPDAARGLRILASVLAEQGRYEESALLSEKAVEVMLGAGAGADSIPVLGALKANVSAQVALGNDARALEFQRRIEETVQGKPELAAQVLKGDLDVALALIRTGRPRDAEKMLAGMLDGAQRQFGEKALRVADIRAFLAMARADLGDNAVALTDFAKSIPALIERVRSDSEADNGSAKRQQRLVIVLERYIRLLGDTQGRKGMPTLLEAANDSFVMADFARGSLVQRALTRSAARAAIRDPQLAALAREEQDAQRQANSLNELLSQLLAAPPEQQLPAIQAKIRADIDQLRQTRDRLKKEIGERFPDYARLVDPPPVDIAGARKMLQPGEVLVSWYFGRDASHVWAIAADGRQGFATLSITRQGMAEDVMQLRKALTPEVATVEDIPAYDVGKAHILYSQLLAPVADVLSGARTLLVVPHAELGQLPLALLVSDPAATPAGGSAAFAAYRNVPWLLRKHAVAQLPSVTALASLRRLPPGDASRLPFIGFGDPYFSEEQARDAARKPAPQQVAMRGVPLRLRNVPRTQGVDSAELALLPRLPDTAQEIREIALALGAQPARDVYLNRAANEKTVFETNLANRRVVMFATHGLVPGELDGLSQPALALSAPGVAGSSGDGLLTQEEILSLKLDADWVVLSACNTAAGEGAGSEAVSGLGRAFFYAGARALLVSNWPVETEASRTLMTDLFRRQAADPVLGKAAALRLAMLQMIDGPGKVDGRSGKVLFSYAHPLFWAPFVLVGD